MGAILELTTYAATPVGMVAIVAERNAPNAMSILKATRIGRIERGKGKVLLKL